MKLRSHLVALVVVALLPLLAFAVFVVVLLARHESAATDRGLRSTARAIAFGIDSILAESVTALETLAASEPLDRGDGDGFARLARRVLPSEATWTALTLVTPTGGRVADVRQPWSEPPQGPAAAWAATVRDARGPVVSGWVASTPPRVVIAVPVWQGRRLRYVLAAELHLGGLHAHLVDQQLPPGWRATLVDRDGVILARNVDAERFVGQPASPAYQTLAGTGVEGAARGRDAEGETTHTVFRRSRLAGWTVAVAVPVALLEAPLRNYLVTLLGGGLIVVAASVGLATLLGHRLAAPIVALARRAERDDAAPPAVLPPATVDEVRALARAQERAAEQRRASEAERAHLLAAEQAARAQAEAARARTAFLAEASSALASTLDYEVTLDTVARLAVGNLADLCVIDLLDDASGEIRRVAAAHADPGKAPLARELQRRFPPDRGGGHPVARALRTGRSQIAGTLSGEELGAIAPEPGHLALARALDYASYLVVPLVAHGRTLGAISLVSCGSGRRYDAEDVPFAEDLARRAAAAIENARLFRQSEQREHAARALVEVGRELNRTLEPAQVADRIAQSVRALLRVQTAVFYRVTPTTLEMTVVAVAGAIGPGFERGAVLPAGTATVGRAVRERGPVATPNVLEDGSLVLDPALRARLEQAPYRAVLAVPLLTRDRVIGVLALGDRAGRTFTADEVLLAQAFADEATLALENARLYTEAQAANRAKDEFLATLSHELRTPLTAMLGWVRLLQSGRLDAAATTRALQVIDRNTRLQAQLIDDLLDISRVVTGKLHLDLRSVDLVGVIEAALDSVGQNAAAKSVTITTALDPAVGPVLGDAHRLQQVVWNLLTNAIRFTPPGGRVTVRLERDADEARIAVADTGRGIEPRFLPYIFDRFRQADATSTRTHGGLGLGLAIVRQLVALHHGTVVAESEGDGRGATFVVRLPLLPVRHAGRTGDEPPPPPDGHALAGRRVLIVDDDPDTRDLLAHSLRLAGADVTAVGSARLALEGLADAAPDVLVSDIAMPEADGYALIRAIRDRGTSVPAVALTAFARAEDRARALEAGFQAHLPKPVEPATLVALVERLARETSTGPPASLPA